mmetsp:Transcript_41722/g.120913  ORF Transcript_41722/g.120913 Transcript_41722/m.120913 type:complete len:191 (+) Transcript_41722:1519-2091(+)
MPRFNLLKRNLAKDEPYPPRALPEDSRQEPKGHVRVLTSSRNCKGYFLCCCLLNYIIHLEACCVDPTMRLLARLARYRCQWFIHLMHNRAKEHIVQVKRLNASSEALTLRKQSFAWIQPGKCFVHGRRQSIARLRAPMPRPVDDSAHHIVDIKCALQAETQAFVCLPLSRIHTQPIWRLQRMPISTNNSM